MNENDYYKWVQKMNIAYAKKQKIKKFINYIKKNHLAIIAIIISIIALFKQ